MAITALPTPPNKTTDTVAEFTAKADAFVAALPTFGTEANDLATTVNGYAVAAAASKTAAETAETNAETAASSAASAPGTSSTSTTAVTVGVGSKTFTVESGKLWLPGMTVKMVYTTDPTQWMSGEVTSYSSTTLVVNSTAFQGSETSRSAWKIFLSGIAGPGYVRYGGVKTGTFTALSGFRYPINTAASSFTATLPASPADGDQVAFFDATGSFDTYYFTVGRNGRNIMGLAEDMVVSSKNAAFMLLYISSTNDWRIVEAAASL